MLKLGGKSDGFDAGPGGWFWIEGCLGNIAVIVHSLHQEEAVHE
jgi:hypothetical protein